MLKTPAVTGTGSRAQTSVNLWLLPVVAGLSVLLVVSIILSITIGPVDIPTGLVWRIATHQVFSPKSPDIVWTNADFSVIWLIRMPRVLLSALVGGGLAVVGVTMQALVRNPLAEPYILGISSGASVGAVAILSFGLLGFAGVYALPVGAFLGALLSFTAVFVLAHQHGQISSTRLILAGVAISYVFSGLTSFITLTSGDPQLARAILSWLLGSLSGTKWLDLGLPALVLVLGMVYLVLNARAMNALLLGEETAATLGIDTSRVRQILFVVASLITGVMVAVSGAIGFVGLMVPHMVRMVVGSDHRRVLILSLLVGSIFLIWVDTIARTAFEPEELPIGVITALLGGPFFLWLMRSQFANRLER